MAQCLVHEQTEKPVCKQQYRWAGVVHFIPANLLVGLGMLPLLIYLLGLVGPNGSFPSAVRALPGFFKPLVFTTPNYLFERTLELQFIADVSEELHKLHLLRITAIDCIRNGMHDLSACRDFFPEL